MRKQEIVSDFSSSEYWTSRFAKERSFEWLANTRAIAPVVLDLVTELSRARSLPRQPTTLRTSATVPHNHNPDHLPVNILHFGCGTSSLGPDLARLLAAEGLNAQVVDADYVSESILTDSSATDPDKITADGAEGNTREIPLINLDVLDRAQLGATAPEGGWDLLLDKSTADAISCGPSMPRRKRRAVAVTGVISGAGTTNGTVASDDTDELAEPILILCDNLASITRIGGRWLCISYSSTRFDHLRSTGASTTDIENSWRIVSATPLEGAYTGDPATISDGAEGKRVVYAPQTSVWAYVLERK